MYIEPHADIQNMTATVRQVYNGFVNNGFSEEEAFTLTQEYWKNILHNARGAR